MGARLRDLLIAASVVAIVAIVARVTIVTREAPPQVVAADRQRVLDAHNQLRSSVDPPAETMPALTWDPLLEQVAREWANTCPTIHNVRRSDRYQELGGSGYVGENMAWGYSSWTQAILDGWGSERASYDHQNNTCHDTAGVARECGHYTQLIWASTLRVGCAQASVSCPLFGGKYYVCNYAPGGNSNSGHPYLAGARRQATSVLTPPGGPRG